jgi:hypothetical protein
VGLKTTWIAGKGIGKDRMLEALGLVETGELEGIYLATAAVAEFPGGWVVVHYDRAEAFKTSDAVAARLPVGEVVWGRSSETVMWSGAYGLRDGRQVWAIEHDGDQEHPASKVSGSPPAELAAITEELARKQAEPDNADVDYLFEAPMALTTALCGYNALRDRDPPVAFHVLEPLRTGAAGERQKRDIALRKQMAHAVDEDLIPAAEALGFQRVDTLPEDAFNGPAMVPNTLVRFRDEWTESLAFIWMIRGGAARIGLNFFAQRRGQSRGGGLGEALTPAPKRSFIELFTGRKEEPADAAMNRVVPEARELLLQVDQHLKTGVLNPQIRPAAYYDGPKS